MNSVMRFIVHQHLKCIQKIDVAFGETSENFYQFLAFFRIISLHIL